MRNSHLRNRHHTVQVSLRVVVYRRVKLVTNTLHHMRIIWYARIQICIFISKDTSHDRCDNCHSEWFCRVFDINTVALQLRNFLLQQTENLLVRSTTILVLLKLIPQVVDLASCWTQSSIGNLRRLKCILQFSECCSWSMTLQYNIQHTI